MKKIVVIVLVLLTLIACSSKEDNLVVRGNIDGLKKGTLFLQKVENNNIINVDSVVIRGDANFVLGTTIQSAQVMYLFLEKADNEQYLERIEFFAEEGEMVINTTLNNFKVDAKITGSTNQEKLIEYRQIMSRFNDKNLELIQKNLEAQRDNNEDLLLETNKEYDRLLARKYLYTVNFAINNKNLEIAPYLALSEVFDANIKYLDTIYNSMSPEVKQSMYGEELKEYLQERRDLEKLESKVEEQ